MRLGAGARRAGPGARGQWPSARVIHKMCTFRRFRVSFPPVSRVPSERLWRGRSSMTTVGS